MFRLHSLAPLSLGLGLCTYSALGLDAMLRRYFTTVGASVTDGVSETSLARGYLRTLFEKER